MPNVSEINSTPLSGLSHVDALLDNGPGWIWLTPERQTIYYTFSVSSGLEVGNTDIGKVVAFNSTQQSACLQQLGYISQLTGITFAAATNPASADLHFSSTNILFDASTAGLCSWVKSWSSLIDGTVVNFTPKAYVYLDNVEWATDNNSPSAGSWGYETLLHEIGHALGLKHPFEGAPTLAASLDNTANTVMSYTQSGGPYATFSPYDVAALLWLYGSDGLGGALGAASTGHYFVGTSTADKIVGGAGNDRLQGLAGSDAIDGGAGTDTVLFSGIRSGYTLSKGASALTVNSAAEGSDLLQNVERLQFSDSSLAFDIAGGNSAGGIYRLYVAGFNRTPDYVGIGFYIDQADKGLKDAVRIATDFFYSDEFPKLYGVKMTDSYATGLDITALVTGFYTNVLKRAPDPVGLKFYIDMITNRERPVGQVLAEICDSPEIVQKIGVDIENGVAYIPWLG
jgi:hypothetical protein